MATKRIAIALLLIGLAAGCQTEPSKDGVTDAVLQIAEEMQRKAITVGNDSHLASKVEDIQALEPEVTFCSGIAHFSKRYKIFTTGSILGIDRYEVGVCVSGIVTRNREGVWHATVTGVERTYDTRRR